MWKISALHAKSHATHSQHCYKSQRLLHVPTQWWHLGCRKISPVFPASNALSSSHSRADDRNKGVDPRPVIISWECRCKATLFSGLEARRKEGRNWGWGGHICGAAEATGTVIGREFDWKSNLNFFPVVTIATKPRGQMGIALSMTHAQWKTSKILSCCKWNRLGPIKFPFSLFLPKPISKYEDISEKSYYVGRPLWLHNWCCKQLERPEQP